VFQGLRVLEPHLVRAWVRACTQPDSEKRFEGRLHLQRRTALYCRSTQTASIIDLRICWRSFFDAERHAATRPSTLSSSDTTPESSQSWSPAITASTAAISRRYSSSGIPSTKARLFPVSAHRTV